MELLHMYIDKHSDTPRNEIDMILENQLYFLVVEEVCRIT
jgi:hypothetical protein